MPLYAIVFVLFTALSGAFLITYLNGKTVGQTEYRNELIDDAQDRLENIRDLTLCTLSDEKGITYGSLVECNR